MTAEEAGPGVDGCLVGVAVDLGACCRPPLSEAFFQTRPGDLILASVSADESRSDGVLAIGPSSLAFKRSLEAPASPAGSQIGLRIC